MGYISCIRHVRVTVRSRSVILDLFRVLFPWQILLHMTADRTFRYREDLNHQALSWCCDMANRKPKRSLGMNPEEAYVMEKAHLKPLPPYIPPVYQTLYRITDASGGGPGNRHIWSAASKAVIRPPISTNDTPFYIRLYSRPETGVCPTGQIL